MSNTYYHFTNTFVPGTKVRSDDMNNELDGITAGFDKLPSDPTSINRGTTYVGTESGSGNTYQVARTNVQTSYQNGDHIGFFATHTNTSSGTLEADGLGAVALVAPDGSALVASDMLNGVYYEAVFDTANNRWQLLSTTAGTLTEADKRVSWATEWATNAEGAPISTAAGGDGATDYSALHWSAKAEKWASTTGAIVESTDYSAKEYASGTFVPTGSAKQWASEIEDTEVTTGVYSALHYAAKSSASAAAALVSENAAATSYDDFDDRYLGSKATDPSLDNDGDALITGAIYWNSANDAMRVYSGAIWSDVALKQLSVFQGLSAFGLGSNDTKYVHSFGQEDLVSTEVTYGGVSRGGTLMNLRVSFKTNSFGASNVIATLRKNGVDTGISVTVTAGSTAIFEDTSNTEATAQGDVITLSFTNVGGVPKEAANAPFWQFELESP